MLPALRVCTLSATSLSPRALRLQECGPPLVHSWKRYESNSTSTNRSSAFEGYYADLLDAPLQRVRPGTRTAPAPPPPDELPKNEKEETLAKARVVFGSRLAGPHERREQIEKLSQNVAGILVPPRPDEPDNCCMSGCVNCVWDRYRDELEEWAEQSAKARLKVQEQRAKTRAAGASVNQPAMPKNVASSMDDDGGGSETNWAGMDAMESFDDGADLFAGVPIGIREFMKTEKKLKDLRKKDVSPPAPP